MLLTIENVAHALNISVLILMFLASDEEETSMLSSVVIEKLSREALKALE